MLDCPLQSDDPEALVEMISREHNLSNADTQLQAYVEANEQGYCCFRRRAILIHANGGWSLLLCTVEAMLNGKESVDVAGQKVYPFAILYEDRLSRTELLEFIDELNAGSIRLGAQAVHKEAAPPSWTKEQVSLGNIYMRHAGLVFSTRFDHPAVGAGIALLAPGQPYYPDLSEAARHWLPFTTFHGMSDARLGQVVFLLPEVRAFLQAVDAQQGELRVTIGGTQAHDLSLAAKGAWWGIDGIHHFDSPIAEGLGKVSIPGTASRVELFITDPQGEIYDHLCEPNYDANGLSWGGTSGGDDDLVQVVREACQNGEGPRIEFKPFIGIDGKKRSDKINEIFRTVVAYANAKGGRILLGIDDDCQIVGIETKLAEYAKATPDADACDRYLGVLRARIRDFLIGDVKMTFCSTMVDGHRVVLIDVAEAQEKPVCLRDDQHLYVRRGSSNARVSPDQWKAVLAPKSLLA